MLRRIGNSLALIIAAFCLFVASPAARAQDITTGLIGYWKLDETSGTTAADSAGTNNGTMQGGLSAANDSVGGKLSRALDFDGSDDQVEIPHNAVLKPPLPITVSAWVLQRTTTSGTRTIAFKNDDWPSGRWCGVSIGIDNANKAIGRMGDCSGTNDTRTGTGSTVLANGQWYHITAVFNSWSGSTTDIQIYVNGKDDNTAMSGTASDTVGYMAQPTRIGKTYVASSTYFDGLIDDVRIYNRALSAADIDALYRARHPGTIQYNTNFRTTEYFDGREWVTMGKKTYSPNAINLQASATNYLSRGAVLGGVADGTMVTGSVWFRTSATAPSGTAQEIYCATRSADNNGAFCFGIYDNADVIIFGENAVGGPQILNMTAPGVTGNDGNWHHLLFSLDISDTNKRHIYIDGVADMAITTYNTSANIDFVNLDHYIGRGKATPANSQFLGDIADLWIDFGTYIDLSDPKNRAKFYNSAPVFLGTDGSLPTGTAPDVFFSGGTAAWHTNKGTGGGFTKNGSITNSFGPSDPAVATRSTMGATIGGATPRWASVGNVMGPDGKIYAMPYSATEILIIDPATGTATTSTMGADLTGTTKWDGGVLGPDRKIYGIPRNATDILIIDPVAGTATTSNMGVDLTGTSKWNGGGALAANGKIYAAPYNSADILIIDPASGTATRNAMGASLADTSKWNGSVLGPNGKIYGIPFDSPDILIIDPVAGTATRSAMGATIASGGQKWNSGVLGPDNKIYAMPADATDILIIDPVAGTATRSAMGASLSGASKWNGAVVGRDGKIYGIPVTATNILVIDPAAGTATRTTLGGSLAGASKWEGGYLGSDGRIYGLPNGSADILIIDTDGVCANPARNAGTTIYNTTRDVAQFCNGSEWIAMGKVPGAGGAGCSSPAGAKGKMVYLTARGVMEYCDGTNWVAVGDAPDACHINPPAVGTACADGTYYIGLSPDGSVPMYMANSKTQGNSLSWNNDTTNWTVTGFNSLTDGDGNTAGLAVLADAGAPYQAVLHCHNLVAHGYSDWYLPSKDELNMIYNGGSQIGDIGTSTTFFWSSTEHDIDDAWRQRMSDGQQLNSSTTKDLNRSVRCVRKRPQ